MPFTYTLATPADDAALRALLRQNPIRGAITLTFEREPSYFAAAALEGAFHQTIVGRDASTGEIVACGNRAIRPLFVNGAPRDIGYMSQLRARGDLGLALARVIGHGFALYRELHADGCAPFYLMSIIADNHAARRMLTAKLRHYPTAHAYTRYHTYAIAPNRARPALPLPAGLHLERGTPAHAAALVTHLNRTNAQKQFAPYWTPETLFAFNLTPADFFLVLRGDEILGCLASWDQSTYKQTVVRGYSGALGRWRKLINWLAPLGGWPHLPEPNTPLRQAYASHLAVVEDDPTIFAALLRAVYQTNHAAGQRLIMLGLPEASPLGAVVRRYHPRLYVSQLYVVGWEDGLAPMTQLDDRLAGIEIALL